MKAKSGIFVLIISLFFMLSYAFGSGFMVGGGVGGGAPTDAHYLTDRSEAGLSAEVNLGALPTGMMKLTVSGGVATPSTLTVSSFVTYATGTAATITTTAGALDFGTIDPVITITSAGTYLLMCGGTTIANGATLAATQTMSFYAYRTNNTPAEITNSRTTLQLPVMTTLTDNTGGFYCQPVVYTTTNTNDSLTVYGVLSTSNPSAGSIQATGAWIMAIGLY